jgi:integrase
MGIAMALKLNENEVKSLPAPASGNKVHYFAGAILQGAQAPRGFGVRVTAAGAKSFVMNYRLKGREYRFTIGAFPDWSPLRAVREARDLRQRIDRGENPLDDRATPAKTKTVADVLDDFVARHVLNKDRPLRSGKEYVGAFERLVKPKIGKIGIYDLRRSHIAAMLDAIEAPTMADRTLAYVRKALNWYAARDEAFHFPMVRGMARTRPQERARHRILNDDEIRAIWPALDKAGTFGAIVKTLLLTGQRRDEVAQMRRHEIGDDGLWTIPAERYKTKRPNHVPLSKAALAVIKDRTSDHVFAGRDGDGPFNGFSKSKAALDKATGVTGWTLHDLRRTAKTLMVRAGVRPDISERVLGHVIAGVEGTYDRHSYADEKRDALERLAAMLERIAHPFPSNVATLGEKRLRAQA